MAEYEQDDTDMTAAEFLATRSRGRPATVFHAEPIVVADQWVFVRIAGCSIVRPR